MTDPNRSLIAVVLDRSGSMAPLVSDVIGGYNAFIAEQRRQPGECSVTLTHFNHRYEVVYNALPLAQVPDLTEESYDPQGNTALLDAMARTINEVGAALAAKPEDERPGRVIVVVITDGEENASRFTTRQALRDMVQHQSDVYGWQFVYLGANVDAFAEAQALGLAHADVDSMPFRMSSRGVRQGMAAAAASVSRRRAGALGDFTVAERAAAQED